MVKSISTNFSDIPEMLNSHDEQLADIVTIDVKQYGAKGDGVTDDSQAFINAIAKAESLSVTDNSGGNGNNRGQAIIYIPPGSYVITQAQALMRGSFSTRTAGLTIKGAGRYITEIQFKPATTNSYLMKNNDAWLHISISDITFTCNDSTSSFMDSYSQGGAQNYSFERCLWEGTWNYGFYLEGGNTNSEFSWHHCGAGGSWNTFLYVPSTGSSDQFLNYDFFKFQFEVSQGDFINFQMGGNINIWGGSYIHYGSTGGTFFKLYGNAHAYGVQRFLCIGARMEHRYTTSVLVDCQWNDGTVSFISVDTSSQSGITGASTMVAAKFSSGNQKMPNIKFDNCSLMGQHQYSYSSNSFSYPHNIMYENCEMTNNTSPNSFITIPAGTNVGGRPTIKFRNCRNINDNQTILWDSDLNFGNSSIGMTQKKLVSMKNPSSQLPIAGQTLTVWLPINSIVTNVYLVSPNGAVTSGASGSFTVQTNEATPTVLGTVSFNPYSNGFNYSNAQFFICNSDAKRQLTLTVTGADQYNGNGFVMVEYI